MDDAGSWRLHKGPPVGQKLGLNVRMLLGLPAGSLMVSKGPEGILLIAEMDGRRAVAIQTKSSLFTLTGPKSGHSVALFTRRRAPRVATGVGGVWTRPKSSDYDLEGWARQAIGVDAKVENLEPQWLPKDAFHPTAYLRFGDTVDVPNQPAVIRFDPVGGSLDQQAQRQAELDRLLKRAPMPLRKITVLWFGDEETKPQVQGVDVTVLDPKHPISRIVGRSKWAIVDRLGRLRAFGSEPTLATRLKELDPGEESDN